MNAGRRQAANGDAAAPRMTHDATFIGHALDEAARLPAHASANEQALAVRLAAFADRLSEHRFQLAVVGQFKRGKSSLLNALLGQPALPTGVLPLTALPTFIRAGASFGLAVETTARDPEHFQFDSVEGLRDKVTEFVAEHANPANVKGVRRIEIVLPAELLTAGVVLIDTPGVGSAALHNTEAAEAALPECDAALLVLSPEPPVTQAELDYLTKIRLNAAKILVAFNKVDAASPTDVQTTIAYLRAVLERTGLGTIELFPVSARRALEAMSAGDERGLDQSGVPALRDRLIRLACSESEAILADAVGLKALAIVRELMFENDLLLAALAAPAEDLDRQTAAFMQATTAFDRERRAAADRIDGDRRRLLTELDSDAERTTRELREVLAQAIAHVAADVGPRRAWDLVREALPERLSTLQPVFVQRHREALEAALADHQARADELLEGLRRTAADLMQIAYRAPPAGTAFVAKAQPYWIDRPRESLADAPASLIERLIPGALGRRFAMRRVEGEMNQVALTNIEHLRWACRLNIEESLRRFARELDETLATGAAAITEGLAAAANLRAAGAVRTAEAVSERTEHRRRLRTVIAALEAAPGPSED